MKESGKKTNSMAGARSAGLTRLHTRATISSGRSTERVLSNGPTVQTTRESSKRTTSKDRACTSGLMGVFSMECGRIIKCTAMECLPGLMVAGTRVATSRTRSRVTALLNGPMARNTSAIGSMGDSMAAGFIS